MIRTALAVVILGSGVAAGHAAYARPPLPASKTAITPTIPIPPPGGVAIRSSKGSGKVTLGDIHVTKTLDKASVTLF